MKGTKIRRPRWGAEEAAERDRLGSERLRPSKVQDHMGGPWNNGLAIQEGRGWAGPDGGSRKKMGIIPGSSLL